LSEIQQAYREEILSVQRFQISQGTNFDIVAVRGKSYRLTFAVLDAKVSFHPLSWLGFFVKGENLTGRDYQILYGYPMPGVTVFGRINVSLR
ncbi:MAG: hypothetical protein LBT49_03245, partial [Prevotellaceae bacterium]|nr:hypothetical protein [Prevotellaceae bacterium]